MTQIAAEQKKEARRFAKKWAKDVKEDGNTAPFWLSLLGDVLGMEHPEDYISFEDAVKHEEKGSSLFVDAWIPSTRVIIEQKNTDAPLDKKYMRHGRRLTPYEQAFEYDQTQPVDQRARYIIACNFHEFWIYDMNEPEAFRKPIKLELQDIPEHYDQLNFLVDKASKPTDIKEVKISVKAGELVGKLYDALHAQYKNPSDTESQKALNVLCVRIVFCLYAEDAGIFGGWINSGIIWKDGSGRMPGMVSSNCLRCWIRKKKTETPIFGRIWLPFRMSMADCSVMSI